MAIGLGLVFPLSLAAAEEACQDETVSVLRVEIEKADLNTMGAAILKIGHPKLPEALAIVMVKATVAVTLEDGSKKQFSKEVAVDVRDKGALLKSLAGDHALARRAAWETLPAVADPEDVETGSYEGAAPAAKAARLKIVPATASAWGLNLVRAGSPGSGSPFDCKDPLRKSRP